jgi:nucleoid-associated protein YgaU
VEHKKQAPAVTPVIPVADNSVVAKVQTSKQVPSVVPVAPVAQNAVVAQAEKKQTVPSVAPAKPVTPVVNSFDVAKAQTSKLVPVAVSAAPVAKNSVVAKAGKKEHVPAVATVTPVAAVSAAPKVDKGEHVAAVAPATPVSGNSAVLATEKTASVTVIAVKQDADLATSDRVLVQKGDSLWKLAEKHLGNGARWPELAKLNPEISDPNIVRIGEWVRVSEEKRDPAKHEVVVQPGDTLSKVAQAEFGNARALRCIAEANPSLQAVDRIYPGETLILPPTCDVTR